ncbi:MAG: hypothetical protein EOO74_02730 [Myxococcales bacterium]|nr:MAG: hypothetical protein EOO74_02730 [Myxococcales bacterium]
MTYLTLPAFLRMAYEADLAGAHPSIRAGLGRYQERVRAELARHEILGRTPDLDAVLAKIGNLAGLEQAVDDACYLKKRVDLLEVMLAGAALS